MESLPGNQEPLHLPVPRLTLTSQGGVGTAGVRNEANTCLRAPTEAERAEEGQGRRDRVGGPGAPLQAWGWAVAFSLQDKPRGGRVSRQAAVPVTTTYKAWSWGLWVAEKKEESR